MMYKQLKEISEIVLEKKKTFLKNLIIYLEDAIAINKHNTQLMLFTRRKQIVKPSSRKFFAILENL